MSETTQMGLVDAFRYQLRSVHEANLTTLSTLKYLFIRVLWSDKPARLSGRWPLLGKLQAQTVTLRLKSGASISLRRGMSDMYMFDDIFVRREYRDLLKLLPIENRPGLEIVDLGANIGAAAVEMKQIFPDARLLCVEPDKTNFELIQRHLGSYPSGDVHLFRGFVGGSEGTAVIKDEGAAACSFTMTRVEETDEPRGEILPVFDLDNLLAEVHWDRIGLVKCDIEGAEAELFREPKRWHSMVRCMLIELHEPYLLAEFRHDLDQLPGTWTVTVGKECAWGVVCAVTHS